MDKKIVMTGVTRGIGRALAEQFVALGHTVVGCGRTLTAIHELRASHSPPHHFSVVDVAQADAVSRWAVRVLADHGPPDLVINNAAVITSPAPLWRVPIEDFERTIDVNVKGVYYVLRAFLPAMIERGTGVVVNISSGWGKSTSPEVAPYCASKWAIEGLNQALAQELPSGIATVALSPGTVDTDMLTTAFGHEGAAQSVGPQEWARAHASSVLAIGERDNGRSLELTGGR